MDRTAPWRALEDPDGGAEDVSPGRRRPSAAALMLAAAAALVLGSLAVATVVEVQPSGQVTLVSTHSSAAGSGAVASQPGLVIQVSGAVLHPGVYSLPAGSRVEDAIRAAGGYSTEVDPRAAETKLNLAAKVQDAQLVVVPRRGDTASASSGAGSGSSTQSDGPVNLNSATAEQLDTLPGVGPATAAKIITSREQLPFAAVDDLVTRKLVSASTLAKFRDQVTV